LRGALLQLRPVSARRGPGDGVLVLAQVGEAHADPSPAAQAPGRLSAPGDGTHAERARRRDRLPRAAADRSVPDAARERGGALARTAFAARVSGDNPYPAADLRLTGADQLREAPLL